MAKRKDRKERKRISAKRRAEEHKTGFVGTAVALPEGVNFFSVKKEAPYRLEILPYTLKVKTPWHEVGEKHFERTFFTHRDVGSEKQVFVCPRKTAGKPCPICEYRADLVKDPDADPKLLKALLPKERQLWNVFDHAEADRGVQVWDVSFHLFGKQLDARVKNADEDDDYEWFADPVDGSTLRVGFTEESIGDSKNSFYKATTIDFKPRKKALDSGLFEAASCLDDLLIVEDYDKLKDIFFDTGTEAEPADGDDDDDEPEAKPAKKNRRAKKEPPKEMTAEEAGIKMGSDVIHPEHGKCSVLKVSGDGTSLTLEDEDEEIHRAVGPEEVELVPVEKPKKKTKTKPKPDPEPDKVEDDTPSVDEDDDDADDWDDDD